MFRCADWPVWKAYHDEHGRECPSCGSYTYDDSESCGNCLAALPVDTSEDDCADHGFDECPDCGSVDVKIGADGYESCARFRSCWTD
jgi:rRNA maturation protein Nop10